MKPASKILDASAKRLKLDSLFLTHYLHVSFAAEVADNSQRLEDSAKDNRLQILMQDQPSIFISPSNVCCADIDSVSVSTWVKSS